MQKDDFTSLTKNLHTVVLSVQDLDRKLGLVGQGRAINESSQEQVIEVLEGTRYVHSCSTS